MPNYVLGKRAPDPLIDNGSGGWCADPFPSPEAVALKLFLEAALPTAGVMVVPSAGYVMKKSLPEAVKNMNHYLENTGTPVHVDVKAYIEISKGLKTNYENELELAKQFAETMPAGEFSITSGRTEWDSFVQDPRPLTMFAGESDLFFAVGGYQFWGQADFTIEKLEAGKRKCKMAFSFHFFDRYNWDGGKHVDIMGHRINDTMLQQLHHHCLAREYDMKGEIETNLTWEYTPSFTYNNTKPNNGGRTVYENYEYKPPPGRK